MGLLQKTVKTKVTKYNIDHFKSLGYSVIDSEYIEIETTDLPSGSGIKVDVECDHCGAVFKKEFRRYLVSKEDTCCTDCRYDKIEATNIKRYGNKCSLRNEDVLNKSKAKNLKNIGCEYPFQSSMILKKCKETLDERNIIYPFKKRNTMLKMIHTLKSKTNISTSKQQLLLHSIFGGILNYKIGKNYIDVLLNENICFEYNGGGHNLSVIHGRLSQSDFEQREKDKFKNLIINGYKIFVIESSKDKLPCNEDLIAIKNKAIQSLNDDVDLYIYNIENKSENLLKINEL